MVAASHSGWWTTAFAVVAGFLAPGLASAGPLDLSDDTPRRVAVRFEVSPHDAPGRLDQVWGAPRRAFVEPVRDGSSLRIRIPGEQLEEQLRSTGADPIRGSFSDFVWTLDAHTGHVLEASVSGRLRERFAVGFVRGSTVVEIRVEMTTRGEAGFRPPAEIFGQRTHAFCRAEGLEEGDGCTLVAPAAYDPGSGYVNAVGPLRARTSLAHVQTFSPLGEALFEEIDTDSAESLVSGRSSHDAVCSGPIRSCRPDLRGESS